MLTVQARDKLITTARDVGQLMRAAGLTALDGLEHFVYLLALKVLDENELRLERIDPNYHTIVGDDRWRFSSWAQRDSSDLVSFFERALLPALGQLSDMPGASHSVGEIYKDARFLLRDRFSLSAILREIASLDFTDSTLEQSNLADIWSPMGEIFDILVEETVSENTRLAQYFTPRTIVNFIIEHLAPHPQATIYDPACGTAGYLVRAHHFLNTKDPSRQSLAGIAAQHPRQRLFGRELNKRIFRLGRMNAIFNNANDIRLENGDSLSSTSQGDKYDLVITTLLFETSESSKADLQFPLPTRSVVAQFLQHIVLSLADLGRAAVAVPESVLFRDVDRDLRRWLTNSVSVDEIISFPPGAFAPFTSSSSGKSSIMLLSAKGKNEQTTFYSEQIGAAILRGSTSFESMDERIVAQEEIEQNGYLLTSTHYTTPLVGSSSYIRVALREIIRLQDSSVTFSPLDRPRYRHAAIDEHGLHFQNLIESSVLLVEAQPMPYRQAFQNQIVIDRRHATLAVVPPELDDVIISHRYEVADLITNRVRATFLEMCFRSPMFRDALSLVFDQRKHVSMVDVLDITVPLPPLAIQDQYVDRLVRQESIISSCNVLESQLQSTKFDESLFAGYKRELLGSLIRSESARPVQVGLTIPARKSQDNEDDDNILVPIINVGTISRGVLDTTNVKHVRVNQAEFAKYRVENDDILFVRVNGNVDLLGTAVVFKDSEPYIFSSNVIRLRLNPELVYPEYVALYINSPVGRREIDARRRGTAQQIIKADDLRSIPIPLPPLGQQQAILTELRDTSETDEAIRQIENLRTRSQNTRRAILSELF